MIASAPGKLILTGEYAVLDGAPAVVIAVDRRAIARVRAGAPRGSSPFLLAVATELAHRRGADDPAAKIALDIAVDSSAFYDGLTKLGLGSSAAVTVAATALALGTAPARPRATTAGQSAADELRAMRDEVLAIAMAAHATAQGARGARGSGADIAACTHGGAIVFRPGAPPHIEKKKWPASVLVIPFFTGAAADTPTLVAQVAAARAARRTEVDAALVAIGDASQAASKALSAPPDLAVTAVIGAFALAASAIDRLALATGIPLVPECVATARSALARLGGTAKTTGAGGGDVGIAVIPTTADVTVATRLLIEAGCVPLRLALDDTGVDLRPSAS
jgi:phosphomevalonate kinase